MQGLLNKFGNYGSNENSNDQSSLIGDIPTRPGSKPVTTDDYEMRAALLRMQDALRQKKMEEDLKKEEEKRLLEEQLSKANRGNYKSNNNQQLSDDYSQQQQRKHKHHEKSNVYNKKNTLGEVIPQAVQCSLYATFSEIQENDPIKNGVWVDLEYDRSARDHNRKSPWRSLYDDKGQMAVFMENNTNTKTIEENKSEVTSRVICTGTLAQTARNNSPFPIGVFLINGNVSRIPENVLYKDRVAEIIDTFYAAYPSKTNSICLAKIIPPDCDINLENDPIFRQSDLQPDSLSLDPTKNQRVRESQRTWMNLTKETFTSSVVNINAKETLGNTCKDIIEMAYILPDSALYYLIRANWNLILRETKQPDNQVFPDSRWRLPKAFAYPGDIVGRMTEEEKYTYMDLCVLPSSIVKKALDIAENKIDELPFENLNDQRVYFARLDASSWDDPTGNVDKEEMDMIFKKKVSVMFQMESWFEVVTEKRNGNLN